MVRQRHCRILIKDVVSNPHLSSSSFLINSPFKFICKSVGKSRWWEGPGATRTRRASETVWMLPKMLLKKSIARTFNKPKTYHTIILQENSRGGSILFYPNKSISVFVHTCTFGGCAIDNMFPPQKSTGLGTCKNAIHRC